MTGPIPPHWVDRTDGQYAYVKVQLPDLSVAEIVMMQRHVDTPEALESIRRVVERHESTKDALREGF